MSRSGDQMVPAISMSMQRLYLSIKLYDLQYFNSA